MAQPVVYFHSDETGAPTLNNVAGSLIGLLDACLINGFNSKSVTSIVVASNLATVTVSAHGYETGRVVLIAGATPSGLNGRQRITVTGANTYTFPTAGISDQSASGTITSKRAPLDWVKQYTGTNKAIYKRSAVDATTMMLRVDDTAAGVASATYARMVGLETASDVDTYSTLFPTAAQVSGGLYIGKGVSNTTAKPWVLVGDDKFFYLFTDDASSTFASNGGLHASYFGDIVPYRAGDAYHCLIGGKAAASSADDAFTGNPLGSSPSTLAISLARPTQQIGTSILSGPLWPSSSNAPLGGALGSAYPSPVDNGVVIQRPILLKETSAAFRDPIRGEYPGLAAPLGPMGTANHKLTFIGLTGFSGTLLGVSTMNSSSQGFVLVDITGPWR